MILGVWFSVNTAQKIEAMGGALSRRILTVVSALIPSGSTEAGWRVVFDLSFFIIITIVGLNIVFTVIVRTFARLRQERTAINEDLERVCIVCRWISRLPLRE